MKEIKIEVHLTPHYHDNKHKPFFWIIFECNDNTGNWYNSGLCGWAETPADAWNEAYQDYLRFKIQ